MSVFYVTAIKQSGRIEQTWLVELVSIRVLSSQFRWQQAVLYPPSYNRKFAAQADSRLAMSDLQLTLASLSERRASFNLPGLSHMKLEQLTRLILSRGEHTHHILQLEHEGTERRLRGRRRGTAL
jgi:hypothetical protein